MTWRRSLAQDGILCIHHWRRVRLTHSLLDCRRGKIVKRCVHCGAYMERRGRHFIADTWRMPGGKTASITWQITGKSGVPWRNP